MAMTDQTVHTYAPGDRVTVRAGTTGGVSGGELGTVRGVHRRKPRSVSVLLDGESEPRDFEPGELDPAGSGRSRKRAAA